MYISDAFGISFVCIVWGRGPVYLFPNDYPVMPTAFMKISFPSNIRCLLYYILITMFIITFIFQLTDIFMFELRINSFRNLPLHSKQELHLSHSHAVHAHPIPPMFCWNHMIFWFQFGFAWVLFFSLLSL